MRTAGLFDLQVNGYAGVDFNDAAVSPDALDHALAAMARGGVTRCLPTLITAAETVLGARLTALDQAIRASRLGLVMVAGIHLEGPFLNPAPGFAGCHPADAMILPDPAVLARLFALAATPVRLVTLAPERPGALELIAWLAARGVAVAIGHTASGPEEIKAAVGRGARLSTHLGNALPAPAHKFSNPLIAQLAEDRLAASFIADGIHVPPYALRVMLRAKGLPRSILVTDATAAAAAPPGLYPFAGMTIERAADGSVRVPGEPVLAGSGLALDQAVRNVAGWGLATPEEAAAMASVHPAALIGLTAASGPAAGPGEVEWDSGMTPIRVTAGGMVLHSAPA